MNTNLISNSVYQSPHLLAPQEAFEEARRFRQAMEDPIAVLEALERGEELCLTKEHLFQVAMTCAQRHGWATAKFIQKFGLTDQTHLFQIAIACARQDGWAMTEFIQKFGLTDQTHLFEVAKLSAQQDGKAVAMLIKNFRLTEPHRLEVAMACAQQDGWIAAKHIQNFCLTEDQRFKVAIACAQDNGAETAEFIQNFHLTEDQRFQTAIACAQQSGGGTAKYIQNFCLTDQEQLCQAAIACAQQNGEGTAKYIQNFHLTEDQRFKAAIACAQQNGEGTAKHIQNFCLTDQEQRFQAAIACAQQNGKGAVCYLQNFYLTDQEQRFQVAIACAQQDGYGTAKHIQKFSLTDQTRLFEIAKLCARQYGGATAGFIQEFGLTDQKQRFEVAMACAQQDGRGTAVFIKNFCLTEDQLYKIAIACAQQNGLAMTQHIQNFCLTNQKQRFEVAMACAQQNGGGTVCYLQNCCLTDEQYFEILTLAVLQDPWNLQFIPDGITPFKAIVCDLKHSTSSKEIIDRLLVLAPPGLNISQLTSFLQNIEETEQQWEAIALTAAALFVYSKTLSFEQLEWVSKNKFLDEILALKAPYLRIKLIRLVKETASSSHFDQITGKLPLLLKLPMAKLLAQGVDLASLKFNKHALRDSAVLNPFLEAMTELADNETLLPEQKTAVIEAMSQKPFDLARDLLIILNSRRSDLLQTSLQRGLPTLAEEAFRSVLPLPQQVKDFSNRYRNTFGSYRQKNILETYAANLNKDQENHPALPALGAHVVSVLEGTYAEDRYNPENNPHLQFLENHHPAILQAWQKNSKPQPLQDVLKSGQPTSASPSMRDWLREKLTADRHLDLNDYPFLEQLLGDDPEPARNSLIEQSKKDHKSPSIALQLKCYALSKSTTEENTLRLLREIELLVPPSEFQNDIKAKIASLTENQAPADLTIVETDDPEDLLVCGTEIRGSCQRVDGNPSLNRGLVGYLLNGQTRMIAVKDKTGRLVARCLLRLLVDKEQKPVLFIERFYSNLNDPRLHTAILEKAKQTADRLLCPLTSLKGETAYGSPLRSLGGPAPWEYVDGASGVQKSEYTINNVKLLYNPGVE